MRRKRRRIRRNKMRWVWKMEVVKEGRKGDKEKDKVEMEVENKGERNTQKRRGERRRN